MAMETSQKESIEGRIFPDDPDSSCPEWKVGKYVPGGYEDYLPNLLEKFEGKNVRVTVEVIP